jgi:3-hydroxyacyl-[acyl-carrier-protein] dehydratase
MQFSLIDRISDVRPGESITAIKALSLAEEYLQDHFPRFPVMPGVLMLEAMFQASAMLVYKSEDFLHSTILLKQARNVKYADFVQPGQTLTVHAEILKQDDLLTTITSGGTVDGGKGVSGRLVLERFNVADRYPGREAWDAHARKKARQRFDLLYRPEDP